MCGLPRGTRIRLLFQGPTEFAEKKGLTNEVAVTVGVLGPITPELCGARRHPAARAGALGVDHCVLNCSTVFANFPA